MKIIQCNHVSVSDASTCRTPRHTFDHKRRCYKDIGDFGRSWYCSWTGSAPMEPYDDKFKIVSEFFKVSGLTKPHLDSFNNFVNVDLKRIVEENGLIKLSTVDKDEFCLRFFNAQIGAPPVTLRKDKTCTPLECRLCDLTYTAPIIVDIEYSEGRDEILILKENKVEIGRMPVMLRSSCCVLYGKEDSELAKLGECPLDPGGYFIVEGEERVFLIQGEVFEKGITVSMNGEGIVTASVTSCKNRKTETIIRMQDQKLWLELDQLTKIPLMDVIKAMGRNKDEFIRMVGCDPCYDSLLEPSSEEYTKEEALAYLNSKVKCPGYSNMKSKKGGKALYFLRDVFLPEVSVVNDNFLPKCIFAAAMVRRIIDAFRNKDVMDDREFMGNIRLKLPGELLSLLFEDLFKTWINEIKKKAEKKLAVWAPEKKDEFGNDMIFSMKHFLGRGVNCARGLDLTLKTGNFNVKRFKIKKKGVTQVLQRSSFVSALAHMTNVQEFEKSRKVRDAKALHPSQFGMLCLCDTRLVEACGLVRNLALLTQITMDVTEKCAMNLILFQVENIMDFKGISLHTPDSFLVIFNGVILGRVFDPQQYAASLRSMRRMAVISRFLSVHVNAKQCCVYVASDGGRVCRPFVIADKGISRIKDHHMNDLKDGTRTIDSFVEDSLVEYLDVNEENDALIALCEQEATSETTHIEIDPFTVLGVCAGIIPYPQHNHSVANFKQCVVGKQAIGNIAYNQLLRMDASLNLLVYPQRPLLTTKAVELVRYDKLGGGQNATVAIMSYSGYNTGDAIVMNKSSIDRGFGRCTVTKKDTVIKQNYTNGTSDRFCCPNRTADTMGRMQILDNDGIAAPGEILRPADIYINKESPIYSCIPRKRSRELPDGAYQSTAQTFKGRGDEIVDRVVLCSNRNGNMCVKFRTRHTHRPEVGDTFSCRHGQKGVCGAIVQQEDLPFSENGICPDLIINPNGFPSGMTAGKMIELLGGKAGALCGKFQDGSAFRKGRGVNDNVETISKTLVEHRFNYSGTDFMYSGFTGWPLKAYIFTGPIYYQTLKDMVVDKSRATPGCDTRRGILTRQPMEGGGAENEGLRVGEMERDCLIAYGASMLISERLMLSSDPYEVQICRECGLLGYYNPRLTIGICSSCKNSANLSTMKLPYTFKLLIQELQSMNIVPRLKLANA